MQEVITELKEVARLYVKADKALENVCGDAYDPIACTVFARKGQHLDHIPAESLDAAHYLDRVIFLHGELVTKYHMNNDDVRNIWFPILNQ